MRRRLAPLLVAATVLGPAAPAGAHSAFLGSVPEPGQRLERTPAAIRLSFTEPLVRRLSKARLIAVAGGRHVAASLHEVGTRRLELRPERGLARGAYRVEWHTVSTDDGHALEGSFSFGVRTAAVGGAHDVEQSPLARGGILRVAARLAFYAALLLFAGALFLQALLPARAGLWIVPTSMRSELGSGGHDRLLERYDGVVRDAGIAAIGLGAAVALLDALDAAGGFSPPDMSEYLLASAAGRARVTVVALTLAATLAARRVRRAPAVGAAGALAAVALSGHANSASPRTLALLTDWVHLMGAATWAGGIALIVAVWGPALRTLERGARLAVMRVALERFGTVALPSFVLLVGTGTINAVIELGTPSALVDSSYGRVLLVKVSLVAIIAAISFQHAFRLRPRLLAVSAPIAEAAEQRHWRLVRSERVLVGAVAGLAALLVAFPLPPRQLADSDEARAAVAACNPCPLPRPQARQLAVADFAGSHVVAAWLERRRGGLSGEVRTLDVRGRPGATDFEVLRARSRPCGAGCRRFVAPPGLGALAVRVRERGRSFTVALPARWRPGASASARRILARAEATMRSLRGVRQDERVTSGPGSLATTTYWLAAPDRRRYVTGRGVQSIAIGRREWQRLPDAGWRRVNASGGVPFRTRSWFRWTPYAVAVRLLALTPREASIALMDPGTPAWIRLRIDRRTGRVLSDRLITPGESWLQRYSRFNRPVSIHPPHDR